MRLAYFPKDSREPSVFSKEFRKHKLDVVHLTPLDLLLQGRQSLTAAVAPGLDLEALRDPHIADKHLSDFNIIFQRAVWSWNPQYGPEIVHFFFDVLSLTEDITPVVNRTKPTLEASKKHLSLFRLIRAGLPVVPFFASPAPIRNVLATRTFPPPCIIKTLQGAGGVGVVFAPDSSVAGDVISLFHRNRQVPLLQPYYPTTHDTRILIVGGQVVAAMYREGQIHKHNISLGGKPVSIPHGQLPPESRELAIRAAELLQLDIAGVDLLETDSGSIILEVNASPSFAGLTAASGLNIPQAITRHLLTRAKR